MPGMSPPGSACWGDTNTYRYGTGKDERNAGKSRAREDSLNELIPLMYIGEPSQNHVFQFRAVTDNAMVSDKGASSDKSAGTNLRLMADDGRRSDIVVGLYFCVFRDPYVFTDFIVFVLRQGFAQLDDEILDLVQRFPGIFRVLHNNFERRCYRRFGIRSLFQPRKRIYLGKYYLLGNGDFRRLRQY